MKPNNVDRAITHVARAGCTGLAIAAGIVAIGGNPSGLAYIPASFGFFRLAFGLPLVPTPVTDIAKDAAKALTDRKVA